MGTIVKFVCKSSKLSLCEGNLFTFYPLKAAKRTAVIINEKMNPSKNN